MIPLNITQAVYIDLVGSRISNLVVNYYEGNIQENQNLRRKLFLV